MHQGKRVMILTFVLVTLCVQGLALAQTTTVEFWHSMTGSRLTVLNNVVEQFNAINPAQQINPVLACLTVN